MSTRASRTELARPRAHLMLMPIAILLALQLAAPAGLEREVWQRINSYREKHGQSELAWNENAAQEARRHCEDIVRGRVPMGHDGFEARIKRLRVKLNVRGAAENVGSTQGVSEVAATMVDMWIGSPGHRRNIEGAYAFTGIGVARGRNGAVCATQIFLATYDSSR